MNLNNEYQNAHPLADRFRLAMLEQISGLIKKNDIDLGVPIESRIKALSSIENKIFRKSKSIENILDIEDFVGIRIILLFRDDIDRMCEILASNFEVLELDDTSKRLAENEFGYQSNHLILKMPKDWFSVPSLSDFKKLKVEVQVRTLSQHIWAAASHKLQYKNEASVPGPLKRSIHRVSALLETIDLELQRLLKQRQVYLEQLVSKAEGSSNINVDVLERLLNEVLPQQNKLESGEDLSELLQELVKFGFDSPDKIKTLIDKQIDEVLAEDAERAAQVDLYDEEFERAKNGVYFTHAGLVRGCMQLEVGEPYLDFQEQRIHDNKI